MSKNVCTDGVIALMTHWPLNHSGCKGKKFLGGLGESSKKMDLNHSKWIEEIF